MAVTPNALVEGPLQAPLQFGLLSILNPRPETEGRWENGVTFQTDAFTELQVTSEYCEAVTIEVDTDRITGEGDPFTVIGSFNCSALGWPHGEAESKAAEHLLTVEGQAVERQFWTNLVSFEDTGLLAPSATELAPVVALATLDELMAQTYGEQGTIHMPRILATVLLAKGALTSSGGQLRTQLGLSVAAGSGYVGNPGDLTDPSDGLWIVGAPPHVAYRSEVFSPGGQFAPSTNDLMAFAYRTYVLGFKPYPFLAQPVTLT